MTAAETAVSYALFTTYLAALLWALDAVQSRWGVAAELSRKLFHIGGGLASLLIPALFARAFPVVLLGFGLTVGFILLRRLTPLRVLSGIRRRSVGEICFPAGVVAAFLAAAGDRLAYSVSILILTFADAGAGLVGNRIGRAPFGAGKTLEGSVVFFALAFITTYLPLRVGSGADPAEAFPVAAGVAFVVAAVEAWTPYGLDNLLIPVSSIAVLHLMLR